MLYSEQKYVDAARICLRQEKRRLQKQEEAILRLINDRDALCEEDHQIMDEGLKYSLWYAGYCLNHLKNNPWEFIERSYKQMVDRKKTRDYLRYKASLNKVHNPVGYRNAEAYGIITFWDGTRERFYLEKRYVYGLDLTTRTYIVFVNDDTAYPVEQFTNDTDCRLRFFKNNL